jgi:hypothetical protein
MATSLRSSCCASTSCASSVRRVAAPVRLSIGNLSSSRSVSVRAEPQDRPQSNESAPQPTPVQQNEASKPPILQQGQGTAIWTGAVSIIFGIAYLVLVFFLDSRGGEMLPPPPEALGP